MMLKSKENVIDVTAIIKASTYSYLQAKVKVALQIHEK